MPTYLRLPILLGLALLIMGCALTIQESTMPNYVLPDADFDLAAYRWGNRLLLVFAPHAGDERLQEQMELFGAAPEGLVDRDLVIVHVLGDDSGEAAQVLRDRYSVGTEEFAVLLFGKDGTLKNRFDAPVVAGDIFGLIDVMPMRIREMREDGE